MRRLDSNGYARSLLDTEAGVCYLCHKYGDTARHEIFNGTGPRKLSKRFGLWVNICPACHAEVHNDKECDKAKTLREDAKRVFLESGHTEYQFTEWFIKGNIKHWEME